MVVRKPIAAKAMTPRRINMGNFEVKGGAEL
jgi:hypothetical protein